MKYCFRLTEYDAVEMFHERVLREIFEPITEDITVGENKLEIEELNNFCSFY
jgi:hypothetical protein